MLSWGKHLYRVLLESKCEDNLFQPVKATMLAEKSLPLTDWQI